MLCETAVAQPRAVVALDGRDEHPVKPRRGLHADGLQQFINRTMAASGTVKAHVLSGMGHPSWYRSWTSSVAYVSRVILRADSALHFHSDEVLAERFPLSSIDGSVSRFMDTDHFTIVLDHAWDIARRVRAGCRAGPPA